MYMSEKIKSSASLTIEEMYIKTVRYDFSPNRLVRMGW